MQTRFRWPALVIVFLWFLTTVGRGQPEDAIWKPILPEAEVKSFVEQLAKVIQEELAAPKPDAKGLNKARAGALLLVAAAQSGMNRPGADAKHLATLRDAGVRLADHVAQKNLDEARKLAIALPTLKADPQAKMAAVVLHKLGDRTDLTLVTMQLFALRGRGGLGLESKPAKNLDGLEARLLGMSRKVLPQAELDKQTDELTRMGYVSALLGEITHALVPEKDDGKKTRKDWVAWSEQMRDAGKQFAEAAKAKKPADLRAAAVKLNASCLNCHDVFRSVD